MPRLPVSIFRPPWVAASASCRPCASTAEVSAFQPPLPLICARIAVAPAASPLKDRFRPCTRAEPVSRSSVSRVSPRSSPRTAGDFRSSRTTQSTGVSVWLCTRPVLSEANCTSPSMPAVWSRMRSARFSSAMPSMFRRGGLRLPGLAAGSASTGGLSRSSMLLTPLASRRYAARTPRAAMRPMTSSRPSSGSTSTASSARSMAANSSPRPASLRLTSARVSCRRGNTDRPIGPLMASVRLWWVFIHSTATPL